SDGIAQGRRREHPEAVDRERLTVVGEGDHERVDALAPAREADGERPADALDLAVERQLSDDRERAELLVLNRARGRENAERDGQIERSTFLANVRRGEIHGDPIGRKREAGVPDRRPDTLPALANSRVGESDGGERG